MKAIARLMVLALCAGVLCTAPPTQAPSGGSLVQEQTGLEERLSSLKKLMNRLAKRYSADESEEVKRKGELLMAGLRFLEESKLEQLLASARLHLEAEKFNQAQKVQQEAEKILERLEGILLEQVNTQDLAKQIERAQALLDQLRTLVVDQDKVKKETARLAKQSRNAAERELDAALADLAEKQRRLAGQTRDAGGAENQADLEQALAALRGSKKRIDRLTGRLDRGWPVDPRLERLRRLLEKMTAAEARMGGGGSKPKNGKKGTAPGRADQPGRPGGQPTRQATPPGTAPEDPKRPAKPGERTPNPAGPAGADRGDKAAEKTLADLAARLQQAAAGLGKDRPRAADPLRRAAAGLRPPAGRDRQGMERRAALAEANLQVMQAIKELLQKGADPAFALEKEQRALENTARRLPRQGQGDEQARQGVEKAAGELAKGSQEARRGRPRGAVEPARKAADRIQKVIEGLEKRLRQGATQAMKKLAGAQQGLDRDAAKAAGRIGQEAREGRLAPEQEKGAGARMQSARNKMAEAGKALREGRKQAAARNQQAAAKEIEGARKALRAGHKPDAATRQEMKKLADRQEELQKEILKLAKRLDPRKDRKAKKHLEEAADQARRAARSLRQGDMDQAEEQEEKARRELQKAEDELAEERNRYLSLRQEDLLFKMAKELQDLITKHDKVRADTRRHDEKIRERGRASRVVRRRLQRLARTEKDIAATCRYLREALEKEQVGVYAFILETVERNLGEIADLLSANPPTTDLFVQSLQEEVTEDLKDLLVALKRNLNERREDKKKKDPEADKPRRRPTNQAPPKPRLVPQVAELKVLRAMQAKLMARTAMLARQLERGGGAEFLNRIVEHLSNRQASMAELFVKLFRQSGVELEDKKEESK